MTQFATVFTSRRRGFSSRGSVYRAVLTDREEEHLPQVREKPEEILRIDRDQVVVRSYAVGLVKSIERRAA